MDVSGNSLTMAVNENVGISLFFCFIGNSHYSDDK